MEEVLLMCRYPGMAFEGFYLNYDVMFDDFGIRLALFGLDMHSVLAYEFSPLGSYEAFISFGL